MDYSPVLAIATASFEVLVAGWAHRARPRSASRSVLWTTSAILLLLAGYQLAEVAICADVAAAGFLPRLAFVIVTPLPSLGRVLIAQLRRPRSRFLWGAAHAMLGVAAGVVVWILVDRSFASASVCNAVYARYTHAMPRFLAYGGFYWAGLAGMIAFSGHGTMTCRDPRRRQELAWVLGGTTGFVGLSMLTSWFVPTTRGALPSILCHFALFLAVCLARLVALERRRPEAAAATAVAQEG